MKQLIVFALLACISCRNQNRDKVSSDNDTVTRIDSVPKPSVQIYKPEFDTIHRYDYRIYEQVISKEILSILKVKLPDWRLPDPKSFEAIWFNYYKKGDTLLNYIHGDFNCDSKPDYALVLEKPDNRQIAAWVLQSSASSYKAVQLEILKRSDDIISNGLGLVNRGEKIQDMEFQKDVNANPVIKLRCDGIEVLYLEVSSRIYYWNKDRFDFITATD